MQTFICNQPVTKLRVASPTWSELSVAIRTVVDLSTQTPTILCKNMQLRHLICQLTTNQTRIATANSHTFCGETYLAHSKGCEPFHIITSTDDYAYGYIPGVKCNNLSQYQFQTFSVMQPHQYCQQESRGNQLRNQAKLNTFGRRSENRDSQKRALWKFDITR